MRPRGPRREVPARFAVGRSWGITFALAKRYRLQADAHTCSGYKSGRRTLHLADREVDKSLTRGFLGNSSDR